MNYLGPDRRIIEKREDLVDTITEAANKLLNDPNSYYHNLKKDEKVQISKIISNEDNKNLTGDFPKLKNELNMNKNLYVPPKNIEPIEPYPKSKHPATIKPDLISREKTEEKKEKYENEAEKRKKLFASKPIIKKKKFEPPHVKLPPAPKYERLPCLECANIKTI